MSCLAKFLSPNACAKALLEETDFGKWLQRRHKGELRLLSVHFFENI